jgi:CPA1 family monovalent cation:H+ antiporter
MAKFKLPERLKIYAESESLFNDVTALIIFYFIALPLLSGGEVSFISINITLFKVLLLSTAIGIVVAAFGFLAIKVLKNPFDQFVIIYLVVIVSFLLAEHFHIAGILSIVASVVTFKIMVQKELNHSHTKSFSQTTPSIMDLIKKVPAITKKEFREYKKEAGFIGIFANAVVFIVIANIIVIDHLYVYYKEILSVFIITTLIRYGAIFAMIRSMKLPSRWTQTLTFAGSKGALAIIMSHSLPEEFIYKDMFIAVVIGNVLLSTFIYTIVLMIHFQRNKDAYNEDIALDDEETNGESYTKSLVHMLEKDEISGAYNKTFLEEILSKEIARAQRYKSDMSLLSFRLKKNELDATNLKSIGKEITSKIRMHDFFGRVSENQFVIATSNTSISGAVVLAEKISHHIKAHSHIEISFGITELEDTDTYETLMEKLSDALKRTTLKSGESVEIET